MAKAGDNCNVCLLDVLPSPLPSSRALGSIGSEATRQSFHGVGVTHNFVKESEIGDATEFARG